MLAPPGAANHSCPLPAPVAEAQACLEPNYDGRPARAVEELAPLASDAELAVAVRLDLLVALAVGLSRLGRTDSCEALEPEIEALVDELERDGIETGWARYADAFARVDAARQLSTVAMRLTEGIERAEERGDEVLAAGVRGSPAGWR